MLEVIAAVPQILAALIALVTAIGGLIAALKARDYRRALKLTEPTLDAVIAGIALMPDSPEKTALKVTVKDLAQRLEVEGPKLAGAVEAVVKTLENHGVLDEATGAAKSGRAAIAIRLKHQAREGVVK